MLKKSAQPCCHGYVHLDSTCNCHLLGTVRLEKEETNARHVFETVPTLQYSISCKGWEKSIAQCAFEDIYGDIVCDHFKDIFITCVRKKS